MLTGDFGFKIKPGNYYIFTGNGTILNGKYSGLKICVGKNTRGVDWFDIGHTADNLISAVGIFAPERAPIFHKIETDVAIDLAKNNIFSFINYDPDPRYWR